jgi:DNA modification methylase
MDSETPTYPSAADPSGLPLLPGPVEYWPLDRLVPYERNPRSHSTSQIRQIAASIAAFGFNNPIGVNAQGRIIVGHARYCAAQMRQLERVPVIVLAHLSEDQERAYRIADNQLALNASWDEAALQEELQALIQEVFDLDLIGFSQQELEHLRAAPELQGGRTDEDAVPDRLELPVSASGDLWQMGVHRLLCGDAISMESVARVMAGSAAAMAFTDPPYNVSYAGGRPIANDDLGAAFGPFLLNACRNLLAVVRGAVYICMSSAELHTLQVAFRAAGGHYSTFVIWAKDHFSIGRSDYQRQYEPILYGWRQGAERFWCGARNQGDVWFFPKPQVNDLHPTMKPVALIERAITNSSRRNEVVLDPFAGAGSTLIACEKTGRQARLIEIDPVYVDVIVRRWEEFSGGEAVLEGSGKSFAQMAAERKAAGAAGEGTG